MSMQAKFSILFSLITAPILATSVGQVKTITFYQLGTADIPPTNTLVEMRGFLYPSDEHGWILASQPNLKSCCFGNQTKSPQIIVRGNIAQEGPSFYAVTVRGVLVIDPTSPLPYRLENASIADSK